MMKILLQISAAILIFYFMGCSDPAPTELIPDDDPLEIEVITKNLEDEFYNNGYDSTGVAELPLNFSKVITVSGIKLTKNNHTLNGAHAQAIFFNKNAPVFSNGRLIGYRTFDADSVLFNNKKAKEIPFIIKFRSPSGTADTILGPKYNLSQRPFNQDENFNYAYNSSVNIKVKPGTADLNVPTPPEVFGKVQIEGNRLNKNIFIRLEWNATTGNQFEIILGAVKANSNKSFPLFRLKTRDDGKLLIPVKLIKDVTKEDFKSLVFTFIKKYDGIFQSDGGQLFVLSQSTHSIVADIP